MPGRQVTDADMTGTDCNTSHSDSTDSPGSAPSVGSGAHTVGDRHSPGDDDNHRADSRDCFAKKTFLEKLVKIMNDTNNASIICWSACGRRVVVHNPDLLASRVLVRYFRHENSASFVRQMNMYGFRKHVTTGTGRWEFSHASFIRGRSDLVSKVIRRNRHRQQSTPTAQPSTQTRRATESPSCAPTGCTSAQTVPVSTRDTSGDVTHWQESRDSSFSSTGCTDTSAAQAVPSSQLSDSGSRASTRTVGVASSCAGSFDKTSGLMIAREDDVMANAAAQSDSLQFLQYPQLNTYASADNGTRLLPLPNAAIQYQFDGAPLEHYSHVVRLSGLSGLSGQAAPGGHSVPDPAPTAAMGLGDAVCDSEFDSACFAGSDGLFGESGDAMLTDDALDRMIRSAMSMDTESGSATSGAAVYASTADRTGDDINSTAFFGQVALNRSHDCGIMADEMLVDRNTYRNAEAQSVRLWSIDPIDGASVCHGGDYSATAPLIKRECVSPRLIYSNAALSESEPSSPAYDTKQAPLGRCIPNRRHLSVDSMLSGSACYASAATGLDRNVPRAGPAGAVDYQMPLKASQRRSTSDGDSDKRLAVRSRAQNVSPFVNAQSRSEHKNTRVPVTSQLRPGPVFTGSANGGSMRAGQRFPVGVQLPRFSVPAFKNGLPANIDIREVLSGKTGIPVHIHRGHTNAQGS